MGKMDVLIIGGGVIGCAVAYNLAKKGVKTLVLEKKEICHGGSSRNGGGIRQSARNKSELPLAMYAVQKLWPSLSEELGVDVEYVQKGNLRLAKTEEHLKILEKIVKESKAYGLDLRMINKEEVKEICPYISEDVIGASYCPTDGHGNPMKTTLAYYKKARELGVEFITGEEVESLIIKKGKISAVKTKDNIYECEKVLVAAGYDSRSIINSVGIDIPMKKLLVEALITEEQPKMFPQMLGTAGSDFYGHQTKHGSFVFGGMTGIEPFASEEDNAVTRSNTAPSICRAILGYFPSLSKVNIVRTWSGFLDQCADLIPVLSSVEEIPGLYIACGFSGHGYGISPAVGQFMSELIVTGESSMSLKDFRYDRFKPKS